jgi:hypothetical protein
LNIAILFKQKPTQMSQYLTFHHRHTNSLAIRLSGIVLMGMGLFIIYKQEYWAFALIIIGLVLYGSKKGIEIDKMQQEFRNFTSYLGYRVGAWHSLEKYPYVTLVRSRKRPKLKYASAYEDQNIEEYFDVCLLSKSHRGRVHLLIGLGEVEARKEAFQVADAINKELVDFEPPKKKRNKYSLRDSRKRNPDAEDFD